MTSSSKGRGRTFAQPSQPAEVPVVGSEEHSKPPHAPSGNSGPVAADIGRYTRPKRGLQYDDQV